MRIMVKISKYGDINPVSADGVRESDTLNRVECVYGHQLYYSLCIILYY